MATWMSEPSAFIVMTCDLILVRSCQRHPSQHQHEPVALWVPLDVESVKIPISIFPQSQGGARSLNDFLRETSNLHSPDEVSVMYSPSSAGAPRLIGT